MGKYCGVTQSAGTASNNATTKIPNIFYLLIESTKKGTSKNIQTLEEIGSH
jgi:hypothetical protein